MVVGNHVQINMTCTFGHDTILEDYTCFQPLTSVNGFNVIKEGAYLGTGVNTIEHITIGEWSIIGAGAAVVKDIPPYVTAVGVPAKPIKKLKP